MSYQLICLSPDGDSVTEGTFPTVDDAWSRNDNMGSRWFFYPIRVVIKTVRIVSACDAFVLEGDIFIPQMYVGRNLSTLKKDLATFARTITA